MNKYSHMSAGFSIVELLIAMAIALMTITAVIFAIGGDQSSVVGGETNAEAVTKAQQLIEQEQAIARQSFSSVTAVATTTDGNYSKSVSVTTLPDGLTKQVTAFVAWIGDHGQAMSSIFTSIVTSPQIIGSCTPTIADPTAWKNPQYFDYAIPHDLISQAPGTDGDGFATADLRAYAQKLYIIASDTSYDDNTFYIFNLPIYPNQMPTYLGRTTTVGKTLNAVTIGQKNSSTYAYVANAQHANFTTCGSPNLCPQLEVINVTDAANPAVITAADRKVTGATGSGGQAIGKSIFTTNGYVYIGLTKSLSGPDFAVFDIGAVSGSPSNPVQVGSYRVGADINAIYVYNKNAYLATASSTESMTIVNVDPTSANFMKRVGGSKSLTSGSVVAGESVFAQGTTTYLGRANTSGTLPQFYMFNSTNLAALSVIPNPLNVGTGNSKSIHSLAIGGTLAFLMTDDQFQVWNIADPTHIAPWTSDGTTNTFLTFTTLDGNADSFSCTGNYFYTVITSSDGDEDGNGGDQLAIITPKITSLYSLTNSGTVSVVQGTSGTATVTRTLTSGFPSPTTISVSGLPAGASVSATNTTCTPTCVSTLTITTTSPNTPPGTYHLTVTGTPDDSGAKTSTFDLVVAPQPFDYSLSVPNPITLIPSGSSVGNGVTITMTSGSPALVTITPSGMPTGVTVNPASQACTPSSSSPYTCTVNFNFSASLSALIATSSITFNATSPAHSASFVLTVAKATPTLSSVIHSSAHAVVSTIAAGSAVHDNASISGGLTPTGTVVVSWFTNSSCTLPASSASTPLTLVGGVVDATSFGQGALNAGSYSFRAHYNGDTKNNAVDSNCSQLNVTQLPSSVSTVVLPSSNVNVGNVIHDQATVSGGAIGATGVVNFILYKTNTCTGSSLKTDSSMPIVGGVANTSNFTTTSLNRSISYQATYPGDSNHTGSVGPCEPIRVN